MLSDADCYLCGARLIHSGDHESEWEEHLVVANLNCPSCAAAYLIYYGQGEADDD